jgi:DNA-directed RNA polymerase subunit RPC12/RpoP
MCADCSAARETLAKWPYFDPLCVYCGSRIVQRLRKVNCTQAEIKQRQQAALEVWSKFHPMAELLELVSGPLSFEPVKKEKR